MGSREPLVPLPVDDVLPRLLQELSGHGCVVLEAPTGSGKTTRVASAILSAGLADLPDQPGRGQIVMLEPRRVAARAAARRIAWERGVALGAEVGYQVRFDVRIGPETRLGIVTDGVLLRWLQEDPFLEQVSVVVFDEFHERGLNVDLALGMVRRIQQTVRPDLKIVVMSATLAAQPIASYLGNCPIVSAQGSLFPVEVEYLGKPGLPPSVFSPEGEDLLVKAVQRAARETEGGILVFLPGVGEIRRATRALESWAELANLMVLPLYGDLPPEQQDRVLAPQPRRKLILATNVAETSLTIDDVTAVVDTGLSRVLHYDEHVGMDRLVLGRISRASADQRRGRAGRTAPGRCYRLWAERDQAALPEFETPEVARVDLAGPVLQLRVFGESDVATFPWFEPPRATSIEAAHRLLQRLGALRQGQVTPLGRLLVQLPVHPRVARLLVEGCQLGCAQQAALAAALLSERDPLRSGPQHHGSRKGRQRAGVTESDLSDRIHALLQFAETGSERTDRGELHGGGARFILQATEQLLNLLERIPALEQAARTGAADDEDLLLQKAVLAAYPDRVAIRRGSSLDRGVMVGGRGVRLHPDSKVIEARLFVCVNVDAGTTETVVRMASAIREEWLDPDRRVTREEVLFDDRSGRVSAVRRVVWDDLVLDEVTLGHVPEELVAGALAEAAARHLAKILPRDDAASLYVARVKCLGDWMPELNLPSLDDDQIRSLLPMLCQGCRTLDDVRRAEWLPWVKSLLTPAQQQSVEREAPERITVPSGNRIAVQYAPGKRPVLAVRIQELFGLAETPRIAGGRVPLLMHLLAPNMRPQQVTDDLRSFWNNAYQQVRKDLRARYPKHSWPEDPWNAPPQSRPQRRGAS